jgi:hypothetical protein
LVSSAASDAAQTASRLDVHQFRVVERESGRTNYYSVVNDPVQPFIHGAYRPGMDTAVYGVELPESERKAARELHWSWRARTLPRDASTCSRGSGVADSAALVYVVWKRGLRWYSLRYAWSTAAAKGNVCDGKRNPFIAQDTVVLESGAGSGEWVSENIDLKAAFRRHFADGDPNADVPDLVGVGLLTDGDQSHSESAADYADFVLRN